MSNERWHGSSSGYNYHRCRCDACRGWNRSSGNSVRHRRYGERVLVDGVLVHRLALHGTVNGYQNYGCRCSACRQAQADISAKRRAA